MRSYKYIARDWSGTRKEGFSQAASPGEVLSWLREKGFTPVSVQEMSVGVKEVRRESSRKRIKSADLAAFCWQLTTMIEGGIPITTALDAVANDVENLQLRYILQQVLKKMQKGQSLSDSISGFSKVFSHLFYAMVLAGETGGHLAGALHKLAEHFDSRDKLAKKVKGAMAYPAFVFGFIVLIVVFVMTFIIPRFKVIFDQLGGELPAFTRGFMSFYDVMRCNVVYIMGFLLLLIIFAVLAFKTKKGYYLFCRTVLAIPLIGRILKQTFVVTFCRTMSTLLASGVPVLEVFDILSTTTGNEIIRTAMMQTKERIVGGSNISLSLATAGFFPNMVVKMVQVGEESGSLPQVLERTGSYYERKVDSTITTAIALLEPIMIVTTGSIVLIVVLALYLPIFSMSAH